MPICRYCNGTSMSHGYKFRPHSLLEYQENIQTKKPKETMERMKLILENMVEQRVEQRTHYFTHHTKITLIHPICIRIIIIIGHKQKKIKGWKYENVADDDNIRNVLYYLLKVILEYSKLKKITPCQWRKNRIKTNIKAKITKKEQYP